MKAINKTTHVELNWIYKVTKLNNDGTIWSKI